PVYRQHLPAATRPAREPRRSPGARRRRVTDRRNLLFKQVAVFSGTTATWLKRLFCSSCGERDCDLAAAEVDERDQGFGAVEAVAAGVDRSDACVEGFEVAGGGAVRDCVGAAGAWSV